MPSAASLFKDEGGTGSELLAGQDQPRGHGLLFVVRYLNLMRTVSAGDARPGAQGWRVVPISGTPAIAWAGATTLEPQSPTRTVQGALDSIRTMTGLASGQIAEMLGVTRQALYLWERGEAINDAHLSRLLAVRDVLARAARHYHTAKEMRVWLHTPRGADGRTPAQLLTAGEIDRARLLAMAPLSARVSPLASLSPTSPAAMQAGRESRIEAYPPERLGGPHPLQAHDDGDPADEGWVE